MRKLVSLNNKKKIITFGLKTEADCFFDLLN